MFGFQRTPNLVSNLWTRDQVILTTLFFLTISTCTLRAQCDDAEGACTESCPSALACFSNEDCDTGFFCSTDIETPAYCVCNDGTWVCPPWDKVGGCTKIPFNPPLPTYTILDLGTLGGPTGQAWSLNNKGQVVGEADDASGNRRAFLWTGGQMQNLHPPIPSTSWSSAHDINESGQVIVVDSATSHFWSRGVFTHIQGLNPGRSARANALNNRGEVVGSSKVSTTQTHAFHWHNQITTDLSVSIGMTASDINNLGQIAGSMGGPGTWHAAFWDGEKVHDLGTLGGETSGAGAINDQGHVMGASANPDENGPDLDFVWHSQQMTNILEVTGRDRGQFNRYALNNCGEILLEGENAPGPAFYMYHVEGGLVEVRGITTPWTPWDELIGFKINDRGQIVGYGRYSGINRSFLASPIRGDADYDGDLDLREVGKLQTAFTGTINQSSPGCERADVDGDGDVDLVDLKTLVELLAGPGAAPAMR